MKRSRGVWAWLALALPVGVAVLIASGCQRKARNPLDETPPFQGGMGLTLGGLYAVYADDEAKADMMYKGKIVRLSGGGLPGSLDAWVCGFTQPRVDSDGEKYIAAVLPDAGAASGKREVVRGYLYLPGGKPLFAGNGGEHAAVVGVCVGKVDGVIVLRKCYYFSDGWPHDG